LPVVPHATEEEAMKNISSPPHGETHNGHPTVGRKATPESALTDEMEPKGYPTSDRYRTETAHADETDNHASTNKKPDKK
jgi:hypothetical protein